ncbi:MAG TPA: BatA domain-containing protein, partial [Acidisoma sp.]|uniref:BatA domain-containing protein n=1 Tax=Acidisoma sp. TaxID=1872115 RepID=UPI002BDBBB47
MIFAAPWLLLAFLVLPLLWWLVRASPPSPRRQSFPALRLLMGLEAQTESPERTPPWLLVLRLLALTCLILGLAGPILNPRHGPPGQGPLLIVLDNSWATAGDWADRMAAARAAIGTAARDARPVALLTTAADADGKPPTIQGPMPAGRALSRLAAVLPQPWPADRAVDAQAVSAWHMPDTSVLFLDDGIAAPAGEDAFRAALARVGQVTDMRAAAAAPLLLPPVASAGALAVRLAALPVSADRHFAVLAEGADRRTLNRITLDLPAGHTTAEAPLGLPTSLANEVTALRIAGAPSAGGTMLLDGQWRRRIVGLVSGVGDNADAPLVGPLYYLNRAMGSDVEIRHGTLDQLVAEPLSALVLSDRPLPPGPE